MNKKIKTVYDGMDRLITAIESCKANNDKVSIALCKSIKAICNELPDYDYHEEEKKDFINPSGIEDLLKGFVK